MLGCDCLWATSIRASLLTFLFWHVFSRDTQEGSFLLCANWQWKLQDSASHCIHIMPHMGPSPQVRFHQYAQQLKAKNARETSWKSHEKSEVSISFLRLHSKLLVLVRNRVLNKLYLPSLTGISESIQSDGILTEESSISLHIIAYHTASGL